MWKKRIVLLLMGLMLMVLSHGIAEEPETAPDSSLGVSFIGNEWNGDIEAGNNAIVSIGREPARVDSVPYDTLEASIQSAEEYQKELSSYYLLLSQTDWRFSYYECPDDFEKSKDVEFWRLDFDDSAWDTIFVPSVWQTQGYDYPIYTNTTQKFARQFGNEKIGYPRDLPKAPTIYNPIGLYRRTFQLPTSWAEQRVLIDFEGVNAAMYLWVNGIKAGYAEDSFTTHEFDITDYVRPGQENVIAVQVYRWCDGSWIEDQDMFDLSGIFRDVYLYATPQVRVRDFAIVTDFDDSFTDSTLNVSAFVRNYTNHAQSMNLTLRLFDSERKEIMLPDNRQERLMQAGEEVEMTFAVSVKSPHKWSAENPYLYTLVLEEETAGGIVYESYRVGFRKITYKTTASGWYEDAPTEHDLIRINGKPITFRGVNRHETHPLLGYALTRDVMEEDIRIMLENNINAVRTSHYPNNPYWYYLCDRYGIYVVDEANIECHSNMTTENERLTAYLSEAIIDREYSMVRRDRNHACVVMWSLGNENKNPEILRTLLVESYPDPEGNMRVLHQYTKDRPWHYEQAGTMYETGIDVRSGMYALPDVLSAHGEEDGAVPMIECEYEHAMGNSEGNFDEYWEAFDRYRNLQGGFIWDFVDQSIALTSEAGELYFGYGGDYGERVHDGNFCANGLLLPDRTVQPEMAEVKYHYQPIKCKDVDVQSGLIEIRNHCLFTDPADQYVFHWELVRDDTVLQEGILDESLLHIPCVDGLTNQPGAVQVQLPFTLREEDVAYGHSYFLNITVTLKESEKLLRQGHVVAMEQFELFPTLPAPEKENLPAAPACTRENGLTTLTGEDFTIVFDEGTGRLSQYEVSGRQLIVPGAGPAGSFYRAATDNDTGFGYGLYVFNKPWKTPGKYVVESYTVTEKADSVVIRVEGTYPDLNGLMENYMYTVYGDGVMAAEVTIIPRYNDALVYVPVAGVQMTVPCDFEILTYYGRGPEENYIDRHKGTRVGLYKTTVTENFFPYVKTSETGNRTDVRWISLTDEAGYGLLAVSIDSSMEASALHYTAEELDRRVHPYKLNTLSDTILRLNAIQIGLGGDNSWSRIVPHEQYLPHDETYQYTIAFAPLQEGQEAMATSVWLQNRMVPSDSF